MAHFRGGSPVRPILQATELMFARNPRMQWVQEPGEYTSAPGVYDPGAGTAGSNTGIPIQDSVTYLAACRGQFTPGRRTTFIEIDLDTFDNTTTYEFELDSADFGPQAHAVVGQGSAQATAVAWAAAFNGAAGVIAAGTASARAIDVGFGVANCIMVIHLDEPGNPADMVVSDINLTGGTGTATVYVDAATVNMRVWARIRRPVSSFPPALDMPWAVPLAPSGDPWDIGAVPAAGVSIHRRIRGYDRVYVELSNITKVSSGTQHANTIARPYLVVGIAVPEEV